MVPFQDEFVHFFFWGGVKQATGHEDPSSETRRRSLSSHLEANAGGGGAEVSLSNVVSSNQEIDHEQRSPLWRNGSGKHSSTVGGSELPGGEHSTLPCIEEASYRSRSQGGNFLSLAFDNHHTDVSSAATAVLSQHLATRGCGFEEAITGQLTSGQADRLVDSPKTLRVCLNPKGLFCWLTATCLGLCCVCLRVHILCFLDSWSQEKHTKRWFLFTKPIRFYTIDLYIPTYTHDILP